jgi:hypothetical protein
MSTRVLTDVELHPTKVKKWLAELPLLNVTDTSRKLFSALSINNRIEIEPAVRLEILELYRFTVRQLSLELQKQYLGLPLPLPEKFKAVAEQNRQFHLEMAIGYKRMVLDSRPPAKAREQERYQGELALALQRAIRYLTGALAISYQSYMPYPLGTWQEIHALYRHAEALGLTEAMVIDAENRTLPASSVSHTYKQALLLDLSDPYHLPARMIDRIHHYLDRWAGLALVLPAPATFDPTCQFLIDQGADRSGIVYTGDITLEQTERYRLLNTMEIARQIHAQITMLQNGMGVPVDGLEPDFFTEDVHSLLLRLIHAFGVHPKRQFRRSPRTDSQAEVAIGLNAVNFWINGGTKFFVSSSFVGPLPQRNQLGAPDPKRQEVRTPDLEYSAWNIADDSAGGMALEKKGVVTTRVRVGELTAVRTPDQKAWHIGVVRWIKSASPSNIEIGVQWIAPTAEAVVVKIIADDGTESDFLPALLLPELTALRQPPSLITDRGIYRPDRVIYMDNGFRLYHVKITKADEIAHSFERFEFTVQTV